MNRSHLYRHVALVLAMLGLLVFGRPVNATSVSDAPVASSLSLSASAAADTGSVLVIGHNFTPSGIVYIALYDQWGLHLYETRWTVASGTVYGRNGSQDPAAGFSRGGDVIEVFGPSPAIFGPNGSQDPAYGYKPASTTGSLCGTTPMVRAFDQVSGRWSDMLDVAPGC